MLLINIFGIIGTFLPFIISAKGGFELAPSFSTGFISSPFGLVHSLIAFLHAFLFLSGGRTVELSKFYGGDVFAILHKVFIFIFLILCARIIVMMPRAPKDIIQQWLVIGTGLLTLVDVISVTFAARVADSPVGYPINAIRYVAPCYVFAVIAGTSEMQRIFERLKSTRLTNFIALGAMFFTIMDVLVVSQAFYKVVNQSSFISALPQRNLATWLAAHNLDYGVGDYWTSQMVTALSDNKIIVDEMIAHQKIEPYRWVGNMANLDARKPPEFVVFTPINNQFVPTDQNINIQNVTATYGKPKAIFKVNGFIVAKLIN
jgi:hypothetical protein